MSAAAAAAADDDDEDDDDDDDDEIISSQSCSLGNNVAIIAISSVKLCTILRTVGS